MTQITEFYKVSQTKQNHKFINLCFPTFKIEIIINICIQLNVYYNANRSKSVSQKFNHPYRWTLLKQKFRGGGEPKYQTADFTADKSDNQQIIHSYTRYNQNCLSQIKILIHGEELVWKIKTFFKLDSFFTLTMATGRNGWLPTEPANKQDKHLI